MSRDRPHREPTPSGLGVDDVPSSLRRHLRAHAWFVAALLVGCLVSASYLVSHPYPAYGAGMYLQIAEQIQAGYQLPRQVNLYTEGLPFAYPPLQMYAAAVIRDFTGVGPITYSRVVPPVVTVAYLVPYYLVASELLETRRKAGLATLLLAVTPETLQWHLSAGGIVRAPAFFLALSGVYVGVRLFRTSRATWVVPGIVLFGLTVLSHPVYPVFFGVTWLLLYLFFDRSVRGLVAGAVVASGGVLLAAPWWTQVAARHGIEIFTAAAGTHNGLGGGGAQLLSLFVYPIGPSITTGFYLALIGATAYVVMTRRFFLPAWMIAAGYAVGKNRFLFVAGSMMVATALVELTEPEVRRQFLRVGEVRAAVRPDGGFPQLNADHVATVALVVAAMSAASVGVLFAGGHLPNAHAGSPSQPAFMDASDDEAMQWVKVNTPADAEFVVLGDQAEWFPLLTDRPIQVGPWGVEWTSPARYQAQLSLFRDSSTCATANCLTRTLSGEASPEYVYVPKGTYTVRGFEYVQSPAMRHTLVASQRYRLAFENDGVMIFRLTDDATNAAAVATGA